VSLPAGATDVRPVGGGYINEGFRVVLRDGSDAFVKTRAHAQPDEYAAEADALRWLAEPGAVRTPRVLAVADGYLALAWIESGALEEHGAEELGRGLAAMHAAGAPAFGSFDGRAIVRFGSLALPNAPLGDWANFYAERRLLPLTAMARERRALSAAASRAIERICARMGDLAGPVEQPARLHGDLWSGNVMADRSGRPWLIDPAAYGGHREIDLAMLRLFGAPSARVFDAYEEATPLALGWRERVELYQLLPLLVHAVLFGGSYGAAAERAALRYTG
jgi:fructosamine-3-kinase